MNWITRAFYTMVAGEARSVSRGRRSYDAAKTVARFGDFSTSALSANAELDVSLEVLRNRSRGLYRNDPMVRRWVRQVETNVFGEKGFRFQSQAKNANGGPDTSGNAMIEAAWKDWSKVCTVDGQMSFTAVMKLIGRTWCRDGEVLIELIDGVKWTHNLAIRVFEADVLDHTFNKRPITEGGNYIRQGIEFDKFEHPVAYHMLLEHPGESVYGQQLHRRHRRVPANRIIHLYLKDRPHQVRGEPPMVTIMTATKMLSGYREAEITGRRLAASKMGFFKRMFSEGQGDIAPLADTELDDGTLEMDVEPGVLRSLPPGVDFEKFDMTTFSTDYEQFERQIQRSIAAGLDVAYANITMDSSNSSYSADRSDQIKQRDVWKGMQTFFIEQAALKIKERWLRNVFEYRWIRIPTARFDKFNNACYFMPRGWSWVDPQKEIEAVLKARAGGLISLTQIAAEQGRDLEEVFTEIQRETEMAEKMKIELQFAAPKNSVAPPKADA